MEPELIADYGCETGENPLWHPLEKRLYWCDYPSGRLFWYDPATGHHEPCYEGVGVGGFTIQADGSLLLFMDQGAIAVLRDGDLTYLVDGIPEEKGRTFNDVIADPAGRVFCGTVNMDDWSGNLYLLDTDGSLRLVLPDVLCSNGLGFTLDRKTLYYTQSMALCINAFDYEMDTGEITNNRTFINTLDDGSVPDGMTVDSEGCLWSAQWDASALIRYLPTGYEERRVYFPAKQVSSVTFGGDDLTDMYVTTAGGNDKSQHGEGAGALFRVNPGVRGMPEFFSKVGL